MKGIYEHKHESYYASCYRKKDHLTLEAAFIQINEDVAAGYYKKGEKKAYQCVYCACWHVGRTPEHKLADNWTKPNVSMRDIVAAYRKYYAAENDVQEITTDYHQTGDEQIKTFQKIAASRAEQLEMHFERYINQYIDRRVFLALQAMEQRKKDGCEGVVNLKNISVPTEQQPKYVSLLDTILQGTP